MTLSLIQAILFYSRAANDHVTAFFQERPIFVFSDNLGYSLLKTARYPNLWPPCGGFVRTPLYLVLANVATGLVFFRL